MSRDRTARAALQIHLNRVNAVSPKIVRFGKKLRDFIPDWSTYVSAHRAPGSIRAAESHVKSHILPKLGDCILADLDTRRVQMFVTALSNGTRTRKTIENILQTLADIIATAKRFGHACHPIVRKELALPEGGPGREVRTLTAGDVGRIISKAKEPFAIMFSILGMTGLRAGELLGLKIEDLDFPRKLIHVQRSVDSRTRVVKQTKTKASKAAIPMPDVLANRLRVYIQNQHPLNAAGFLFVNRNGNTYAIGKVKEYGLWPAQDLCGIRRSGLHAFRRQVSTELLDRGASPSVAQKQMRHKDVMVTLRHYAYPIEESHRNAVSSLATIIEGHTRQ